MRGIREGWEQRSGGEENEKEVGGEAGIKEEERGRRKRQDRRNGKRKRPKNKSSSKKGRLIRAISDVFRPYAPSPSALRPPLLHLVRCYAIS